MYFRYFIVFFHLAILLFSCSERERRILVVHSYEESYTPYSDFNKLIQHEFRKNGIHADIHTYYLSCEEYNEPQEIDRMNHFLDSIADWDPELILVNDDQATYSLLRTEHPLVKRIPVIFAGVNYPNEEVLSQYSNVTGFHDKMDLVTNVRVIKDFCVGQRSLFTVLDATFLDRKIREDAIYQFAGTPIYLCDETMLKEEQNKRLEEGYFMFRTLAARGRQMGAGFLWSVSKYSVNPYLQLKRDFTTISVSKIASTLCFTAINESFGYSENLLAGYLTPMSIQVEEEVGAAVEILQGKNPADMPIQESRKVYVADWEVMVKNGITKQQVPEKYEIINMPFRERYPSLFLFMAVFGGITFVSLFAWLLFLYQRENKRRKLVVSELEEEREALALAIQGGNTYAWSLKEGYMELENSFWESLNMLPRKLTPEEAILFIHPDYRKVFKIHLKNLGRIGKHSVELLCDFNGNGFQWWEFRYSTVHGLDGGLRTAGLMLDIQDFKEREQELIEARELAEKAELKQSFLANMSHEIRTPLNAIVGFSNILVAAEALGEEDKKQYIDIINTNSELLLKLINDILELSRIESGYMSFKYEDVQVGELIDEVYTTHQVLVPRCLEFLKESDESVLCIQADRGRLTQVLTNFLNNASKFTLKGYIKLGYYYVEELQEVHIYVEDTGKGISKSEQKMIFNRFYKQDEFAQGTGLGLSICKVIIERLNGKIGLLSEVGGGSRFTIVLPVVKVF